MDVGDAPEKPDALADAERPRQPLQARAARPVSRYYEGRRRVDLEAGGERLDQNMHTLLLHQAGDAADDGPG
jgi:hypothetical protein